MLFSLGLRLKISLGIIFLFLTILIWIGCNETPDQITAPDFTKKKGATFQGVLLSEIRLNPEECGMDNPYVQAVAKLQERYESEIFGVEGVHGFGITHLEEEGRIAFIVEIEPPMTYLKESLLPKDIEGIPIVYRIDGRITLETPLKSSNKTPDSGLIQQTLQPGSSISGQL